MASGRATLAAEQHSFAFDDRNLRWSKLRDLEHFVFLVFDVDLERGLVDFIVKFDPNQRIILHRHLALTNTLVVKGEHRLYEPSGALKEIRPVGSYTSSPPGEPHREGGGDEECVVFYSVRGGDDVLFELLDDSQNVVGTLSRQDFIDALEEQRRQASS
jgi:quercetin dioxygenase-like cupin family protein